MHKTQGLWETEEGQLVQPRATRKGSWSRWYLAENRHWENVHKAGVWIHALRNVSLGV